MVNRSVHPSICPSDRALKAHRTPVHFCLCLSATLCLKSLCYSVKTFLFPHSHDLSSSGNLGARLLRFGSYCTISRTVLSFPSLRPSPPSPRVGLELAVVRITSNVRCSTTFNISSKVTAADYIAETTARIGSAGDTALPCISPYPCLQHFSFTFHFTFFRSSSADADKFFASRFFFLSTRFLAIVHFPRRPSRRSSRFRYSVSLAFLSYLLLHVASFSLPILVFFRFDSQFIRRTLKIFFSHFSPASQNKQFLSLSKHQ